MCVRFNLGLSASELAESFELEREPAAWKPRYNVSPMQRIVTIRNKVDGQRHAQMMQWGLVPAWANDPSIGRESINARANLVFSNRTFRNAFLHRRCLIPATGYFEWQKLIDDATRPWHIYPKDGQPIAFAGIWESWRSNDRTTLCSCPSSRPTPIDW